MTTYICDKCFLAFEGKDKPKDEKVKLLLTCPSCGSHKVHEANEMEEMIYRGIMKELR